MKLGTNNIQKNFAVLQTIISELVPSLEAQTKLREMPLFMEFLMVFQQYLFNSGLSLNFPEQQEVEMSQITRQALAEWLQEIIAKIEIENETAEDTQAILAGILADFDRFGKKRRLEPVREESLVEAVAIIDPHLLIKKLSKNIFPKVKLTRHDLEGNIEDLLLSLPIPIPASLIQLKRFVFITATNLLKILRKARDLPANFNYAINDILGNRWEIIVDGPKIIIGFIVSTEAPEKLVPVTFSSYKASSYNIETSSAAWLDEVGDLLVTSLPSDHEHLAKDSQRTKDEVAGKLVGMISTHLIKSFGEKNLLVGILDLLKVLVGCMQLQQFKDSVPHDIKDIFNNTWVIARHDQNITAAFIPDEEFAREQLGGRQQVSVVDSDGKIRIEPEGWFKQKAAKSEENVVPTTQLTSTPLPTSTKSESQLSADSGPIILASSRAVPSLFSPAGKAPHSCREVRGGLEQQGGFMQLVKEESESLGQTGDSLVGTPLKSPKRDIVELKTSPVSASVINSDKTQLDFIAHFSIGFNRRISQKSMNIEVRAQESIVRDLRGVAATIIELVTVSPKKSSANILVVLHCHHAATNDRFVLAVNMDGDGDVIKSMHCVNFGANPKRATLDALHQVIMDKDKAISISFAAYDGVYDCIESVCEFVTRSAYESVDSPRYK